MDKQQYEEYLKKLLDWTRQPWAHADSTKEAIEQACSDLEKILEFQVSKELYALNGKKD